MREARRGLSEEEYSQFVPMEQPTTHQQQLQQLQLQRQQTNLNTSTTSSNPSILLFQQLGAYSFSQLPQQAPPHPPQQQFQLVQPQPQQQQQQQQQQQLIPQFPMTTTMT